LVGCDSGASFDLGAFSQSEFVALTGATVEVCLNSVCRDQAIDTLPAPNNIEYLYPGGRSADPRIEVSLWRTDPSGAIELQVVVASTNPDLFADGDVYTIKVSGSSAGSLADRAWSAAYRISQPNGPVCEPTCREASTLTQL
jgi:hypothetical protein